MERLPDLIADSTCMTPASACVATARTATRPLNVAPTVVVDHALGWLSQIPKSPFFLWIHLYDAHDPYDPPAPFKEKYASKPYDGEIAYIDVCVG